MDRDFNGYSPYIDFGMTPPGMDANDIYKDPMFNPIMQYEQACSYYRYLCTQMDYKIKCKEYDIMCGNNDRGKSNSSVNANKEIR